VRGGADTPKMRSTIGLCALFGTFAGGYVPSLWGGSGFSLSSVLFAVGGGIAGVWLGVRLSA
jgi:outer membrane lipoprotein SlyB